MTPVLKRLVFRLMLLFALLPSLLIAVGVWACDRGYTGTLRTAVAEMLSYWWRHFRLGGA